MGRRYHADKVDLGLGAKKMGVSQHRTYFDEDGTMRPCCIGGLSFCARQSLDLGVTCRLARQSLIRPPSWRYQNPFSKYPNKPTVASRGSSGCSIHRPPSIDHRHTGLRRAVNVYGRDSRNGKVDTAIWGGHTWSSNREGEGKKVLKWNQ